MNAIKKHTIALLVLPDFVPFDLSIPYDIFSFTHLENGINPYEIIFCAENQLTASGYIQVSACQPLETLQHVDTIFVPGLSNPLTFKSPSIFTALQKARDCSVRIASICTGACVLAAAGLLDGLKATTHWELTEAFTKAYPKIQLEPDILFVDNGQILTSAGLASGVDLCLHMIRKDLGSKIAEKTAQFFMVPIERDGSLQQRVKHTPPKSESNLAPIIFWLLENLHLNHSVASIADHACMSSRTLNRKFQEQMGASPMVWITRARIKRAQALLESTTLSVEQIATAIGFNDAAPFRERFRQLTGVTPMSWRKTWTS